MAAGGRRAFLSRRSPAVRQGGVLGRENVGMSNRMSGEKPDPRKSKGSSATEIGGGLGGPKAMAKAATEGQQVNIPALPYVDADGVTERSSPSVLMVWRSLLRAAFRKIRMPLSPRKKISLAMAG